MMTIFSNTDSINGIPINKDKRRTYKTKIDTIKPGDVWKVNFPYEEKDSDTISYRPCVVLSVTDNIVEVVRTTHGHIKYKENILKLDGFIIDCGLGCSIKPKDFHKKIHSFDDAKFAIIKNKVDNAKKKNRFSHLTLEMADYFFNYDEYIIEGSLIIQEAKLKASERTDFGLPEKKKYPMPDADHVRAAIRMFNHCDPEDEAELARNIKKYMKKHGVKDIKVSDSNRFSKYYNEGVIMEGIQERYLNENDLRYFAALDLYEKEWKRLFGEYKDMGERRKDNWYEIGYLGIKHARIPSRIFNDYKTRFEAIYDSLIENGFDVIFGEDEDGYIIRYNPNTFGDNVSDSMNKILSESAIQEAASSKKFKDMKFIYDSLSDEEKAYMGNKFIDSPAVVFRKVAYTNDTNTPVGFVELYDAEKLHGLNDEVIIETAVHKRYRGNGVAKALVNAAIKWFKSKDKYQKIIYLIKEGNKPSKALCEATGFKYIYTERDHDVYYFVKNDTPLTEEFLFGTQEEESDDMDIYLDSFDEEEVETPENIARDIKAFVNESKNRLSSIEEMSGGGGPMIGMEINDVSVQNSAPGMYIIAYGQKKVSNYTDDDGNESGYAIANDFYTKHIFVKKGKKAVREDYNEFLDKREFRIYKYIGEMTNWYNLLKSIKENKCDGEFYTALTGRQLLTMDQIDFDENFEYLNLWKVMLEADIIHPVRDIIKTDPVILLPCVNEEATSLAKDLRKMNPHWDLREGVEGYYVVDEKLGFRSSAYDKDFLMKVLDK